MSRKPYLSAAMNRHPVRSLISIFFLFCLGAPFYGSFAWLQLQKKQLKREIKWKIIAGIDKKELANLRFHKSEINEVLRWEHAKEFEYQGEMYDVVESTQTVDSVYYWCWWDHEETELNKRLNLLLTKALGEADENENERPSVEDILEKVYLPDKENNNDFYYTQLATNWPRPEPGFRNFRLPPPLPPPKLVS